MSAVVTTDMVLLAALAATGLRMVILQSRLQSLEEQAITDPLTGAFNRRHMEAALDAAVERSRRGFEPASLLLLDVDRFKDINDAHGHGEGDRVLRSVVTLVNQRKRKVDALFRSGGEEFVLLLSGTRFAEALRVAEDLRGRVEHAALLPRRQVSISIGVVELSRRQSAAGWMAEADEALYRAKRTGRNRVAASYDGSSQIGDEPVDSVAGFGRAVSSH